MSKRPAVGFDIPLPAPGRALRRGHWSTDGLKVLLLPNTGTPSVNVYDVARDLWIRGDAGVAFTNNVPTPHGLMNFTSNNDGMEVAANSSLIVPTSRGTIIVVRRKVDTTARNSCNFAVFTVPTAPYCQARTPYGNGTAYFEVGDPYTVLSSAGVPVTTDGEAWIFVWGPRGMAMYRNGALLASNTTVVVRTPTTVPFYLNIGSDGSGSNGDLAEYSFFAILDAEWNAKQVEEWTDHQDLMFVRQSVVIYGSFDPPSPTNSFTIAGTPRDILQHWSISEQLNERGTMRFGVKSMDASYRPGLREVVDFNWFGIHFFAGHIHHTEEGGLGGYGVVPIVTDCGATDFNALPDRRQVAITLPAGTLKSMLELLEPYLTDYGVTLDPAQVNGPTLVELTFTLGTLTAILDKLSVVSEYAWEIDYDNVLRMFAPGAVAAPFDLVDGDTRVIGDVRVSPTTVNYANRIIVLAGTGTHDVADNFVGDGVEDTFELNYTPVTFYGYVTVNGTEFETLRVVGDPDAATWEYDPATNSITRLTGAPADLDTIVITFVAQFPFEVIAEDVPAQDGGANLFEKVFTHPEVFDAVTAQALADGYLVRSLVQPREVRYRTRLHGVHPGMQQQIQRTGRNIDGPCLITAVDISPEGSALYNYDITAVEGLVIVESTQEKWRRMGGRAA